MYELFSVREGYCCPYRDKYSTACTCTLIKGKYNVIVNTLSYFDRYNVLSALSKYGLGVHDINYVVSTHARPDYFGNNNIFRNSIHIVGNCISKKMEYQKSPLSLGNTYYIDEDNLKVIPTPGYTLTDLTVVVRSNIGIVYITGELFQCQKTFDKGENSELNLFTNMRRIEYPIFWRFNRNMVVKHADYIVPGHGEIFRITDQRRRDFFKAYNIGKRKRRRNNNSK
ncbi:unnamed protein product [Nezara viridula]|uniref:Metallo-beta-lactamase domain-containing protein n=1 Tax=Nezara viridula TaxID=85310 RepID=A0A9P0HNX4_NEZVI|nr:unnamed protein product [Nezara viridula]